MFRPSLSGRTVNRLLQDLGLQKRINSEWIVTLEGKKYCSCFLRQLKNGRSVYQLKWDIRVKDFIQYELSKKDVAL